MGPLTALNAACSRVYSVATLRLVNEPIRGVQETGLSVDDFLLTFFPIVLLSVLINLLFFHKAIYQCAFLLKFYFF